MKNIKPDVRSIATCGLYCGACRKYLARKCPGCKLNAKASWCKVRTCCMAKGFSTCADCPVDVRECKLFSNWVSKVFAFLFRSDRPACIRYIREHGEQAFAEKMARSGCQTIKKQK